MFFGNLGKTFMEDLLSIRCEGSKIYIHFKDSKKYKINLGLIKSMYPNFWYELISQSHFRRDFASLKIENSIDSPQSINLAITGKPLPTELMSMEPKSAYDENWCIESMQRSTKLPVRLANFPNVEQVHNFLKLFTKPEEIVERLVFTKRAALGNYSSMKEVSIPINNLPRNNPKMHNKLFADFVQRIFSSMLNGFQFGHYEALPYLSRIRFNQTENGISYFGAFFPVDVSDELIEAELKAIAFKALLYHYMDFNEGAPKWQKCLVFTGNTEAPSSFFQHPDGMHFQ